MSKVLYVKVKIDGYLEAQPTAENLMLPGGYALSHSGILLPKYSPVAGYAVMPDDETDFAQLSVLTVQSTRPQGYESEVLASGYVTQLAWYQVTVPDNYTYNGDGGGGGQPLPPVPHKEDFYSYQGDRWTTGFSDSKGIWHEYPDIPGRPGWQAFWTVADQPALRAMAAVLEGANGLTNEQRSAIFFGVAELAGLQSSVSSAKAIPAAQLKFDALHAAAFHLVDVITSPSGIYDNERAWLQAGNAFWKAQKAIETSLSSSLAAYYKSHVGTAIDGAVLKQTLAVLSSQSVSAFHLSSNDDVIVSYGNNALEPWLHVGPDQSASDFFFDLNPADQFFNIAGSSETSIYKGIVFGSIRNDSITLSTLTGMHVYAGPGSDAVLNYAASGTIDLGDGNDVIYSSGTFGVLRGGKGFDQLLLATDFGVSIDLSSKSMTFNYTNAQDLLFASIDSVEEIYGSSYADVIVGDKQANMLFGGYGSDLLNGGAGNDTLNGGADLDQLWGGTGKDRFEFSDFNIIDWAADSVNDFAKGDTIVFSQGLADDYGFNVLKGKLDKNSFVSGASAQAHDADDRFIYDTSSHTLWFDPDGDAGQAAVEVATFANNYSLTAADIAFV